MSELLRHMVLMYKWGLKTAYYDNTNDGAGEVAVDELIELPSGEKQEQEYINLSQLNRS